MNIKKQAFSLAIFVTPLFLVFGTLDSVSAQSDASSKFQIENDKQSIQIEVINSANSPILITEAYIKDNPYFPDAKTVEFTVQNISQKKVIAFTPMFASKSFSYGSTTDSRYDFEPGKTVQSGLQIDRHKIKSNEKFKLSMDYILFSDLTWWGPDSQKNSEKQAGYYSGQRYAIDQTRELIRTKNSNELFQLLAFEKEGKIGDHLPEISENKTDEWRRGFSMGYAAVLVTLLPYDPAQKKYLSPEERPDLDGYISRLKSVEYSLSRYLDENIKFK